MQLNVFATNELGYPQQVYSPIIPTYLHIKIIITFSIIIFTNIMLNRNILVTNTPWRNLYFYIGIFFKTKLTIEKSKTSLF